MEDVNKPKMKIELGMKVVDVVTGFTGITTSRCSYMYGCDRWDVQPPVGADGKIPDSATIDEPQLKIMDDSRIMISEEAPARVALGQRVRCTVTDYEGIVYGAARYINGCLRVALVKKQDKEGKLQDPKWFDEGQIEIIEEKSVAPESSKKTGGPAPCMDDRVF